MKKVNDSNIEKTPKVRKTRTRAKGRVHNSQAQVGLDRNWQEYSDSLKETHWYDHSRDFDYLDNLYENATRTAKVRADDAGQPQVDPKKRETLKNTKRYIVSPRKN